MQITKATISRIIGLDDDNIICNPKDSKVALFEISIAKSSSKTDFIIYETIFTDGEKYYRFLTDKRLIEYNINDENKIIIKAIEEYVNAIT